MPPRSRPGGAAALALCMALPACAPHEDSVELRAGHLVRQAIPAPDATACVVPPARVPGPGEAGSGAPAITRGADRLELRELWADDCLSHPHASAFAWSGDGESLASVSRDAVFVWSARTGAATKVLALPDDLPDVGSVALSPDGRFLAYDLQGGHAEDGQTALGHLWLADLVAGTFRLLGQEEGCHVSFSADGAHVLTEGATRDERWEVATGRRVWAGDGFALPEVPGHAPTFEDWEAKVPLRPSQMRRWLPDGRRGMEPVRADRMESWALEIQDVTTSTIERRIETPWRAVVDVSISRDGRFVAVLGGIEGPDGFVDRRSAGVWSLETGARTATVADADDADFVVLADDGAQMALVPSYDRPHRPADAGTAVWDLREGRRLWRRPSATSSSGAFTGDGRSFVSFQRGYLQQVHDARTGAPRGGLGGLLVDDDPGTVYRDPGGRAPLVSPALGRVAVLAKTGLVVFSAAPGGPILAPGRRGAVVAELAGGVRVEEAPGGRAFRLVSRDRCEQLAPAESSNASVSPDGRWLYAVGFYVSRWDLASRRLVSWLLPEGEGLTCVFPALGAVLTDNDVLVDVATARRLRRVRLLRQGDAPPTYEGHAQVACDAGRHGLYAHPFERVVNRWDTQTGLVRTILTNAAVSTMAPSHDGTALLAGGEDGRAWLWQERTNGARELPSHARRITALVMSSRGDLLATAGGDGLLRLLDASTLAVLAEVSLAPRADDAERLVFSADGGALFVHTARGAQLRFELHGAR